VRVVLSLALEIVSRCTVCIVTTVTDTDTATATETDTNTVL